MKFFAVILLSLFISVKSSTVRRQDGTFDANAKTNVKSSTARTQDGIFHESAKTNGAAGLSVIFTNDTKHERQLSRHRRSVVSVNDKNGCYRQFFAGQKPPYGFQFQGHRVPDDFRYICQQYGIPRRSYFSTMLDVTLKIPVYSAYVVYGILKVMNFGYASTAGKSFRSEEDIRGYNDEEQLDEMYSNTGELRGYIHIGQLVPAETYSISDHQMRSTFTYTNAVPQYASFNSGKWTVYEQRIRNYAKNKCSARGGDLYLLTGTSDIRITGRTTGGRLIWKRDILDIMPEKPYLAIPNSMWTAGCCIHDQEVLGAIAVIGNNDSVEQNTYTFRLSIEYLEYILSTESHQIKLFPGKILCAAKPMQVDF